MAGKSRKAGKAGEPAFALGEPRLSDGGLVRVVILAALLLLAIYTFFGVQRLERNWTRPGDAGPDAAAQVLAARLDVEAARRNGGLTAGVALIDRSPDSPIDAAETVLRGAGDGVLAAAVVAGDGIGAVAGRAEAADWKGAARQAIASGRSSWIGVPAGDPGRLYVARVVRDRTVLLTTQDLSRLPLRAAGRPPIGESISPSSPARRISIGMAYFAGTAGVFASADFRCGRSSSRFLDNIVWFRAAGHRLRARGSAASGSGRLGHGQMRGRWLAS